MNIFFTILFSISYLDFNGSELNIFGVDTINTMTHQLIMKVIDSCSLTGDFPNVTGTND